MDKAQLKAEFPDLYDEIHNEGAASVDTKKIETDATAAEQDRVIALAGVVFGEDESEKFGTIVKAGVDADKVQAIKGIFGAQEKPTAGAEADDAAAKQALAALKNAGAGDDAGAGDGEDAGGGDAVAKWNALVDAYAEDKGVSKADAIKRCMQINKKEHAAYLKAVNTRAA